MNIISKAEFARQAGVTSSAISKVLNTALKEALNGDGIDADHPAAIRYLSRCGRVGRRPGGSAVAIGEFVCSRLSELKSLENLLPLHTHNLVKNLSKNLYYIGFAYRWIPASERDTRMTYVESSLDYLNSLIQK